jgi:hypothetical protein
VGLKSLKSLNLTNGYPNKNKKNNNKNNKNNNKVKSKPLELRSRVKISSKKKLQKKVFYWPPKPEPLWGTPYNKQSNILRLFSDLKNITLSLAKLVHSELVNHL